MAAIEIENLKFRYDKNSSDYAVDGISLNVEKGEYVSVIGHNGSGKSTLAKLIIGLLESESGSVRVFGTDLNSDTVRDIRGEVGIVFQNPDNQFIGATVRDDIAFGLENHCVPHEDMEALIDRFARKVHMEEFLDKEPSALSGGQKQRVAIAGVLAMNPKIIILDEATAMLDPRGKGEIVSLVHQLKEDKPDLTILSITHDLEEASISDRVIVMNRGKLLWNDTPDAVFAHEKELVDIGLDIPFLPKLKMMLRAQIDLENCRSLKEVKERLCR